MKGVVGCGGVVVGVGVVGVVVCLVEWKIGSASLSMSRGRV